MSKMNDMFLLIQEMLDNDIRPATIASILEIPANLVYEVLYYDTPEFEPVDDKVLDDMARFYGSMMNDKILIKFKYKGADYTLILDSLDSLVKDFSDAEDTVVDDHVYAEANALIAKIKATL